MTASPPLPSLLYFAGDRLSRAELCAARLDGDLVEVGEAYLPADAVETAALRARSLLPLLTPTVAAAHTSAAWIHGALDAPPARHTLQRCVGWRLHQRWSRRFVYRESQLPAEDLMHLGGIAVTTPARTLVDLVRGGDPADRAAAHVLATLHPGILDDVRAWVAGRGGPGAHRAVRAFLRAAGAGGRLRRT
jgi:hypothetical protein